MSEKLDRKSKTRHMTWPVFVGAPANILLSLGNGVVSGNRWFSSDFNKIGRSTRTASRYVKWRQNSAAGREIESRQGITWTSNGQQKHTVVLDSPWRPSLWGVLESMIKSAKRAINAFVGDANDEELVTVFICVESLLNSRA